MQLQFGALEAFAGQVTKEQLLVYAPETKVRILLLELVLVLKPALQMQFGALVEFAGQVTKEQTDVNGAILVFVRLPPL